MLKKFVVIILFFSCYLTYAMPSLAEAGTSREIEKIEGKTKSNAVNTEKENKSHAKAKSKKQKVEDDRDSELIPEELEDDLNCTKDMQYTEEQKKRLDQIYHRIYKDYHALIETYAWAGALTDEQVAVRHSMLKNYILTFAKRNYKWCSEWEEDEWEEEWYNIDRD